MKFLFNKERTRSRQNQVGKHRDQWTGKLDFLLSCAGYTVGIGNIWRFPYLCFKNGGGAFLIAYSITLVIGAYPMFLIDYGIGQFSGKSSINMWAICPLLKGAGYGSIIVSSFMSLYFNVMVSWIFVYIFNSFSLPWTSCNNSWNTPYCFDGTNPNLTVMNMSKLIGYMPFNQTRIHKLNTSLNLLEHNVTNHIKVTPNEEFWRNKVLGLSDGIDNLGSVKIDLLGGLCLAWIFVFCCVLWGIKVTGKVVYFTACFPYIVLIFFLVKAVTLPGAVNGIKFYLVPKWDSLFTTKVWGEAATQVLSSAGIGYGGLITFSSYNYFHNNIYRDSLISPAINSGTSVFAGFVTFSLLGHVAHEKGVPVEEVAVQGPGLIFQAYPSAISKYPLPQLWSFMFFFMMFSIAIDSQLGLVETVISGLMDEFNVFQNRRPLFVAVYCILQFLLGIPMITQGGMYILQIIDWYHGLFTLMIVAIIECIVVGWVYGTDRFLGNIEHMIGYRPCQWWGVLWKFITPVLLLSVLVFNMIQLKPVSYGTYEYPTWATCIGWIIGLSSVAAIVGYSIVALVLAKGSLIQRLKHTLTASTEWKPAISKSSDFYINEDDNDDEEKL